MSDVEKYGLFAVVVVGGLLLVIALQGGFSSTPEIAPVLIGEASALTAPEQRGAQSTSNRVRVKSIMPETAFDWSEPAIAYPGERAAARPGADGEPVSLQAVVPAGAPVVVPGKPAASVSADGMHTVAEGETLSSIAGKHLGSEHRWKELASLNPGLDPRKLKPGMQVRVRGVPAPAVAVPVVTAPAPVASAPAPAKPAAQSLAQQAGRTHTVVKGDTLGAIAKKYLGSSARADDVFEANTDVLKNKDDLKLGQVLRIP